MFYQLEFFSLFSPEGNFDHPDGRRGKTGKGWDQVWNVLKKFLVGRAVALLAHLSCSRFLLSKLSVTESVRCFSEKHSQPELLDLFYTEFWCFSVWATDLLNKFANVFTVSVILTFNNECLACFFWKTHLSIATMVRVEKMYKISTRTEWVL